MQSDSHPESHVHGRRALLALLAGGAGAPFTALAQDSSHTPKLDVPYVPTPQEVVDAMLKLARVTAKDTVYDLGCGDGRIVVSHAFDMGGAWPPDRTVDVEGKTIFGWTIRERHKRAAG